ncbi:MAG: hypothetical protein ABI693_32910 [Bryobacteraceae bacterium]
MQLMGMLPLLLIIVAVATWRGLRFRGHAVTPKLALSDFTIQPQAGGPIVRITGTATGLAAVLQTILGLESDSTFEATECGCEIHAAALWGETRCFAPLAEIASVQAGYFRSVGFLLAGTPFLLGGLMVTVSALTGTGEASVGIPTFAIGLILLIAYFLSKALFLSVRTRGGTVMTICFKKGPADLAAALAAAGAIRDLLRAQRY